MFTTRQGYCISGTLASDVAEPAASYPTLTFNAKRRPFNTTPFASITSNLFQNLGQSGTSDLFRKERNTGVEFPHEYCHRTKTGCPGLTGLGVRSKKILGLKNINVYALGIYADHAAAKKALLGKYKGKSHSELSTDQGFIDDVVKSDNIDKTLRLVISFGLKHAQFVEALHERLAPSLKQAGDSASLDAFVKQFDGVSFAKGTEVVFCQTGKNTLVTKIGGEQKGVIHSAPLCHSLLGLYLGADTITPEAKKTFADNIAQGLSA